MRPELLYAHTDYRGLLKAWISSHARRSQATLARKVGVSRSLVAMVLAGSRGITLDTAWAWAKALTLDGEHRAYFEALVRKEHGETLALRKAARLHVRAARDHWNARRPTPGLRRLFGDWTVPVLLELARVGALRPSDELAATLWPPTEPEELDQTLEALEAAGALERRAGRLRAAERPLATPRDLGEEDAAFARAYHRAQLAHAEQALEELPADTRHLGSVVVAVDPARLPELRQALHRFHLEVIEPYRVVEHEAPAVVQVSVQLLPRVQGVQQG